MDWIPDALEVIQGFGVGPLIVILAAALIAFAIYTNQHKDDRFSSDTKETPTFVCNWNAEEMARLGRDIETIREEVNRIEDRTRKL